MRVAFFSTKAYDRRFFTEANRARGHTLRFLEPALDAETAPLAQGFEAVSAFVNDRLDRQALATLAAGGTRLIALRCAGFNQVDVAAAAELGLTVARVPAYSPHAVAEHTVALILTLNRRIHRAHARVREGNFELEGLLGFDLFGKAAGIVGTGEIGAVVARILHGFGCTLLASDPRPNPACEALGARYVPLEVLLEEARLITLHCPLTPATHHLIDDRAIARMRRGALLVNTSRGGVVDTRAAIAGLKSGQLGALALDVYEEEAHLFFKDLSNTVIQDDLFARLQTFPNVLITAHQAFFTEEALAAIADTTLGNVSSFDAGALPEANSVTPARVVG